MHLWTRVEASLALLTATVALAAADSQTYPPTEILIDWDYETTGLDDSAFLATTSPEEDTTRDIESSRTTHQEYILTCPPVHLNLSRPCGDFLQCKEDGSCPEGKICCPSNCGGVECRQPVIKESFPQADEEDFTTTFTTDTPADWTTREPVYPSTHRPQYNAQCPLVHLNLSLPCGDFRQCEDDGSCSEDKICCPNDCGGVECVYPAIKGSLPPIEKEEKISESESETQISEHQPPRAYVFQFLMDRGPGSCCSKLDPQDPNRCSDKCIPWVTEGRLTCLKSQECRPNHCGVYECMDATNKEEQTEMENERVTPFPEYQYDEMPEPEFDEESPVDSRTPITEWSPLCPKLDLRDGEPCRAVCSPRRDVCPEGRVCCRNKCGYGECMDAVVEEQPAQKEKEKFFWELYAKNTIHEFEKNVVS